MRIALSLMEIMGVHGLIVDGTELVAGWFLIPETSKKSISKKLTESKTWPVMRESVNIARINPSSCFVDMEKKVDNMYKGYQVLLINNRVSFKNSTLDKQYFLVKFKEDGSQLNDEELMEELKSQFFNKALKKLPLPINENWEEYVWDEIKDYFTALPIHGKVPYQKAYVMELPDVDKLQNLVEISHKSHEFKTKFKRVPKLKAILAVSDIQNFNFKEFQNFLKLIGGPDVFTSFNMNQQKAMVQAFEILGSIDGVKDFVETWHATSVKEVGILLRLNDDKQKKALIKSCFKRIFEMFKDNQTYLYPAINNFGKLFEEHHKNIKNNNIEPIKSFLNQIQYDNVTVGAEELAIVCSSAKVSDGEYLEFERLYLQYLDRCLTAPRSYPTIRNSVSNKTSWELIDMSIPRAWVVGIETHCCMHPHSCGGACLEYAAQNPETSGILRITENGKTIAQSFMWIANADKEGKRTLVLDNIEVLGNTIRTSVTDAYKDFAEQMEFYAKLFKFKAITIGAGYSDVTLSDICIEKLDSKSNLYGAKPDGLGYYDAGTQWLFKKF